MMRVLRGVGVGVVWLLLGASLVGVAQEHEDKDVFPLTDDEREIAALKIDLLDGAALTLQWKRQALVQDLGLLQRNTQLLAHEDAAWAAWREDLQAELTALFGCADVYDLATEMCTPVADPELLPPEVPR